MISVVSLLSTAALVSLCGQAYGAILNRGSNNLDNNLHPNAPIPRKRTLPQHYLRMDSLPEKSTLVHGEQLVLECNAYACPRPSAMWLKNGVPVDYEELSNEIFAPPTDSLAHVTTKLVVKQARDGDVFTCLANSGDNEAARSTTIVALGQDDTTDLEALENILLPSPPIITLTYPENIQTVGTNLVLPCRVESGSKTHIYWTDSEEKVVVGNSRHRILPNGDLLFVGLRWADMGMYTCVAKNAMGQDTATSFVYPAKLG